ncbi:hypothetical protein BDK51DRAFT_48580 [Blyttiomyces helicus]|uniref:Uncharacterized protein n=1 Tax=Blyttiomyces helicus TaxID=388810 RepID=A0A4P9VYU4_9FUNG|nr:hypothetical protein BDK51DRAFT_48580 [Blyttiomyces helicus]|eukprot:RKO82966.1 hypothetical protein BDK51DRAFT_48580 [Blyttiomyces helicus]
MLTPRATAPLRLLLYAVMGSSRCKWSAVLNTWQENRLIASSLDVGDYYLSDVGSGSTGLDAWINVRQLAIPPGNGGLTRQAKGFQREREG